MYYFARRFVAHDDADDAVTEAFIKLWQQRSRFDALPKIERWLFVTVRNYCISVLRRDERHQSAAADLIHILEESQVSAVYEESITTELIHLLYREIDKLPARQREIFMLSFSEGLKPAEIAARLSLSVKTVKNQKSTAIRLLQEALGERATLLAIVLPLSEQAMGRFLSSAL